jgi:hypothetical protein
MLNYLIKHAIDNVWCVPFQDRQAIIELSKMTPLGGSRNFVDLQWDRLILPTKNEYYHVYVIGQNTPNRLNLSDVANVWYRLDQIGDTRDSLVELYTVDGLRLAQAACYIQYSENRIFFIAVKIQQRVTNLDYQNIYCRLYSNTYFDSSRDDATVNLEIEAIQFTDVNAYLPFQHRYNQARLRTYGAAYMIRNGYYVDSTMPNEIAPGDYVDWTFDGSVKQVVDFKLDELSTFHSSLDNLNKYLLHVPKGTPTINYRDDIDIYLIKKTGSRFKGVLYQRNSEKSLRMVTHNDYSIPTSFIQNYITSQPDWSDVSTLYIRFFIKHSGFNRPLVDEANRIKELYKLTDEQIVSAMVGLDANVPEFTADVLESSNYTKIMRNHTGNITKSMMTYAYGYNAMAKLTADTPQFVVDNKVILKPALWYNSTIFEYDSDGLLLEWHNHNSGESYYPVNPNCVLIEGIVGIADTDNNLVIGVAPVQLNKNESYRFYLSSLNGSGQPMNNWRDITGDTSKYSISATGVVTWTLDIFSEVGCVKGNAKILCYDLTLPDNDSLYKFSITYTDLAGQVMYIPPGSLEIWMNGYGLIENLDYYVNYPQVIICNKKYLLPNEQRFTIRATGFCNPDMSRVVSDQVGFVQHGRISVDGVYHLRDDKIIKCLVGGAIYDRAELSFAEDGRIPMVDVPDGTPYEISDVVAPVRNVTDYDTFVLRPQSLVTDKRVSDYMSLKLPEPVYPETTIIVNFYHLYSPFMAKLINDLQEGYITEIPSVATDSDVADWVAPYLYLLDYDPTYRGFNEDFVNVHPHDKTYVEFLTAPQYLLLERINRLYLNNKLDFTSHVGIQN